MSLAAEREDLDALLARMGIEKYDLLLVGDGSGSTWERHCGWGCVSIERDTMARRVWHGAMNHGTVNFAELMAYLQPLVWYVQREMKRRKEGKSVVMRQVHILTDSSYASNLQGSPPDRRAGHNVVLWQVFRQFTSQGVQIHWHWIPRESVELNRLTDAISKKARIHLESKDLVTESLERFSLNSIYEFNAKD